MPTYVALIDWTDQGVRNFKDTVDRYEGAQSACDNLGVRFTDVRWTLGTHDIVATVEAPDDETLAAALLSVQGRATSARRPSARSPGRRCAPLSTRWAELAAGSQDSRTAASACGCGSLGRRSDHCRK